MNAGDANGVTVLEEGPSCSAVVVVLASSSTGSFGTLKCEPLTKFKRFCAGQLLWNNLVPFPCRKA